MNNDIVCTFKWEGGAKGLENLLPTELNRIFGQAATALQKAVPGAAINQVTVDYAGKHITVPTGDFAKVGT